jgi:ABC-type transporter Mla subunit MlaD
MARVLLPAVMATIAVLTLACGPATPDVRVSWGEPVEIEVGAAVRYRGVPIGEVVSVALLQSEATSPAQVELGLRIDDASVTLRADDVFEISSDGLLGDRYVAITPAPGPSEPLPRGARVVGTPALATRMRESADAVMQSLGEMAREKTDALIDAWARAEEERPPPRRVPRADRSPPDEPTGGPARAGD